MLFFYSGVFVGIALYDVVLTAILLASLHMVKRLQQHWQRIFLFSARPVVDALVVSTILMLSLELFGAFADKNTGYIAGEVTIGCFIGGIVVFVFDVLGGSQYCESLYSQGTTSDCLRI